MPSSVLFNSIGGGASYMKVRDMCAAGNTEACKKVKYAEGGNFLGTVATVGAASGVPLVGEAQRRTLRAACCIANTLAPTDGRNAYGL